MGAANVYGRVSGAEQEGNYSLPTQIAACREYAAAHGYAVAGVYQDVHTGAELWERPQMSALRESVRRREVDAVIAYAVDRLSRKQTHVAIIADECERAGVALLFVTEGFERTAVGEFLRGAKAFAAELEREKIRERTQRGKLARLQSGKLPGFGWAMLGYRYADEAKTAYEVDEETAPLVRRIFDAVDDGSTLRQLCRDLDADGILTPQGRSHWTHATLKGILTHRGYLGEAIGNRRQHTRINGKRNAALRPVEETVPLPAGTIPPLVTREQFARVQRILAYNARHARRTTPNEELFLLRGGFAVCGYCGAPAWANTHHKSGNPEP